MGIIEKMYQAALELRLAQREYMELRASLAPDDPIREAAGKRVGHAAEDLDDVLFLYEQEQAD